MFRATAQLSQLFIDGKANQQAKNNTSLEVIDWSGV
jgi:hypothetical protein